MDNTVKAFILAAGRGERMRPLTDNIPKPLLKTGGKTLIEHRLLALKKAGISECIINVAYLGEQIQQLLGTGEQWGMNIKYSDEGSHALESGGGIINALALIGNDPFIVVNADIWTDFDFCTLPKAPPKLAQLILVDNPEHNPKGDFTLKNGTVSADGDNMLTYSGIAVFRPELFKHFPPGSQPLRPILISAMQSNNINGQHFEGIWRDIGTPKRLQDLQKMLQ